MTFIEITLPKRAKRILIIDLLLIILIFSKSFSQEPELIGIVGNQLVLIDKQSGKTSVSKDIQNLPAGENIADLTYHETNDLFYSIRGTSNSPSLVSISREGEYQPIGSLTLNGNQILMVEALAYNKNQNKLYAAVSLNGGVNDNDFYSESIVEVNPSTGECLFVTEISTNQIAPDIDVMAFDNNTLYIFDGAPPGANFLAFYKLEFASVNTESFPDLIYQSTYLPIQDFTIYDQAIYFTEDRSFYKFGISNSAMEYIGETHQATEFNGNIIKGVSKLTACNFPQVDLGNDTILCNGQNISLKATFSGATYNWQDGSSDAIYTVTQPGFYWVEVTNSCGIGKDTIEIIAEKSPDINLGEDVTTCDNIPIILDATFRGTKYTWQDDSSEPTYTVNQSGIYWVEVKNFCGSDRDTIEIIVQSEPTINLGEDRIACNDIPIVLDATFPDAAYTWQDGSEEPMYTVSQTGTYWVKVENSCGTMVDSIRFVYYEFDNLNMPNVFTPNKDHHNEYFEIDDKLIGSSIKIVQRTGKVVYESKNYQNDWDGGNLPSGTYYYLITNKCGIEYKGWVTILR